MSQSCREPWELRAGDLYDCDGERIIVLSDRHLQRIAACINACTGLSTEQLQRIDSVMARVLPAGEGQVSQIPIQGGNGEEARANVMGAAAGDAARPVRALAELLGAFLADIEDVVERVLAKHGILKAAAVEEFIAGDDAVIVHGGAR